jgi:small subunit ribosomal protein S18
MPKKKRFTRKIQKTNAPKKCQFCTDKKEPLFSDTAILNKFITDRAKIVPMSRSGICTKHQKRLAVAIKRARHLALLPFIVKV